MILRPCFCLGSVVGTCYFFGRLKYIFITPAQWPIIDGRCVQDDHAVANLLESLNECPQG